MQRGERVVELSSKLELLGALDKRGRFNITLTLPVDVYGELELQTPLLLGAGLGVSVICLICTHPP